MSLSLRHPRSTSRDSHTPLLLWSKPSHQSLKSRRGTAQADGHPLPLVQAQITCESSLFSDLLSQRNLSKAEPRCSVIKNPVSRGSRLYVVLGRRLLWSLHSGSENRNRILAFPLFFLAIMTTLQAHGEFESSIISYSSNISARHASNL